jgi:lipoprotein-anchoring transpeptidase ErfK/SrfK
MSSSGPMLLPAARPFHLWEPTGGVGVTGPVSLWEAALSKPPGIVPVLAALALAGLASGCGRRAGEEAGGATAFEQVLASVNGARFSTPDAAITVGPQGFAPVIVKLQVLLDRARFSPGVIDGQFNDNTRQALKAFENASSLPVDGVLDRAVWTRLTGLDEAPVLVTYTVDPADVAGPFIGLTPRSFQAMSRLESLGYRDATEALAETFHMTPDLLMALNAANPIGAPGGLIVVAERGSDDLGVDIALVEVDRAEKQVRAYAADQRLLAVYPATIGSLKSPPPLGRGAVDGVMAQPTYRFETDTVAFGRGLEMGPLEIAPGPNNPVGSVWVEVDPNGYGLHGTPEPQDVGKPVSAGGVRMTNWDARELARGLREGTPVVFR